MSFLQPILLAGLPLVGLPVLIHLINRWRHRTLPWGAMRFLLDAKRLTRGMARLRFWLIMAMRMLAIAALLFALARPLTSGWMGLALGGQVETTIIVLDRSASMEQQDLQTRRSKRSAALEQVATTLESYGRSSRIVLIESTQQTVIEAESAEALIDLPETTPTATAADLPGMLQQALEYVVANETGRTDIWVCSDRRENDWSPGDGRWASLRDEFHAREGVKFYLLTYPGRAADNVAVRALNVRQQMTSEQPELVFDVHLQREGESAAGLIVPCEIVVNGARSVVNVELSGDTAVLQGHRVPIDDASQGGWGFVEIPADENMIDNVSPFVFAEPPPHQTTIVYDNPQAADPLRFAATAPLDPGISYSADVLPVDRIAEIDLTGSSLVLWQARLPEGVLAEQLEDFLESGRPVIFFPPEFGGKEQMCDVVWGDWQAVDSEQSVRVASWRGDADLLAHARSGEPLGLGELQTYAYRELRAEGGSPLARLDGGAPLLLRAGSEYGPAYFCATLPLGHHSTLARDGVALYAMIQRALAQGAATLSHAVHVEAGSTAAKQVTDWQPSDPATRDRLLSSRWVNTGAFENGPQRLALNRPEREDLARVLDVEEVDRLFSGLDYQHVEQTLGETTALTSEVWRAVLAVMALALMAEALLCLPERRPVTEN